MVLFGKHLGTTRRRPRRWLTIRPAVLRPSKLPLKRANVLACVGEGVWAHTVGFMGRPRPLATRMHWYDVHTGNSGELPLKEPPTKVGVVWGWGCGVGEWWGWV